MTKTESQLYKIADRLPNLTPPNKAQPQHDYDEIVRQAGLQAAKSNKWGGWSWQAYQTSITRQNHHISKIEAHADKLAEALRNTIAFLSDLNGSKWIKGDDVVTRNMRNHAKTLQQQGWDAFAAYESEAQ